MRLRYTLILLMLTGLAAAGEDLFTIIRTGSIEAIERAVAGAGDGINARDANGATPLMYAAILAPERVVAKLLAVEGIDVNAATKNGTTALTLAIRDAGKVRMLLEKGANVNVTNQGGISPLLAALSSPGNTETVKLLLANGAAVTGDDRLKRRAISLANRPYNREIIPALAAKGFTYEHKENVERPLGELRDAELDVIRAVLDSGADPNEVGRVLTLSLPALANYAGLNRADAVKLLLERGANPNLAGNKGQTALMTAAMTRNPDLIRTLLKAGSGLNLKDKEGLTALDWALKKGETEIAAVLREAGGVATEPKPWPKPVAEPRTPSAALDKALPLLINAAITSSKKVNCINCHNNSLPAIALTASRARGRVPDGDIKGHHSEFFDKALGRLWESAVWNDVSTSYIEWALVEEGYPRGILTDVVALRILRTQRGNGRWGNDRDSLRPPLASSAMKSTAFAIRVLDAWAPTRERERATQAIAKARQYLEQATASDTQDAAFQLLGLKWSGGSASVARLRDRLAGLQREDGGWGQMPTMRTDAYATGQALAALHAAGMATGDETYQRGIQYLLRSQLDDGSWFVPTRALGIQPYYESGFPHGAHQYISASATSWAVMALAYTLPQPENQPRLSAASKGVE